MMRHRIRGASAIAGPACWFRLLAETNFSALTILAIFMVAS